MKIIYVQTYPLYHDIIDAKEWLAVENRDKWMPGCTARLGYETELWGGADSNEVYSSSSTDLPDFTIRTFKTESDHKKSKKHISKALCDAAATSNADLFVLKGMDGGIGIDLAKKVLIPMNIPYSIVIGGTWYHPIAKKATSILYETDRQKSLLANKSYLFQKLFQENQLIKLPKSIDTEKFRPHPQIEKKYDVIVSGRLISYYKNYDALAPLSKLCRVAVIGGGPELGNFKEKYPSITWLGHVPHQKIPEYLALGKLFFHTGKKDFFPRVIPEAAACGLPVVAFKSCIDSDVLPEHIGIRLSENNFTEEVMSLLKNSTYLEELGLQAREHAQKHWGKFSSESAIVQMLTIAGLR